MGKKSNVNLMNKWWLSLVDKNLDVKKKTVFLKACLNKIFFIIIIILVSIIWITPFNFVIIYFKFD